MKKYEFTGETKEFYGHTLHRIRRLSDGLAGGWIESEACLSQDGACFVFDSAQVYGSALVSGNAWVRDNARVCGNARVQDNAQVRDSAQVSDSARVSGTARVLGTALVCGEEIIGSVPPQDEGILAPDQGDWKQRYHEMEAARVQDKKESQVQLETAHERIGQLVDEVETLKRAISICQRSEAD